MAHVRRESARGLEVAANPTRNQSLDHGIDPFNPDSGTASRDLKQFFSRSEGPDRTMGTAATAATEPRSTS